MGYGFLGFLGLGKENNWGSAVAVTDYFYALTEDLKFDYDRYDLRNISGSLAEPDDSAGVGRVAGSITAGAHPVTVGHFLKGIMQQASGSVVKSNELWKTEFRTALTDFDAATTPVQPYTFEIFRDVGSSVQYGGCVFDQLELNMAINQNVRMKASIIGRNQSVIAKSTTTPTYPGSPLKDFAFDTVSLSVGGSATARIEAFNLTINNNLEGVPALNMSSSIAKIRRKNFQQIGINGTIDFTDMTEYLDFINQTERQWIIAMSMANSFGLAITIPRVVYTAFPTGIPGRERLTVNFTGKAFYSTGSGTAINFALTTVKSNY